MSQEPDIHIRRDRVWYRFLFVAGLVVFAICLTQRSDSQPFPRGYGIFAIVGLTAIGLCAYSTFQIFDTAIRLSLTAKEFVDHRIGVTVKWIDILTTQLEIERHRKFEPDSAILHLKVANTDGGTRDVAVNVLNLEFSPDEIAEFFQRRRIAAAQAEAESPEVIASTLVEGIKADLKGGIPLSFAVNKLTKQGLAPDEATEIVAIAAEGNVVRCSQCSLDYHASIETCGVCGQVLHKGPAK
jgi:hypothetical protein